MHSHSNVGKCFISGNWSYHKQAPLGPNMYAFMGSELSSFSLSALQHIVFRLIWSMMIWRAKFSLLLTFSADVHHWTFTDCSVQGKLFLVWILQSPTTTTTCVQSDNRSTNWTLLSRWKFIWYLDTICRHKAHRKTYRKKRHKMSYIHYHVPWISKADQQHFKSKAVQKLN